MSQKVKDVVDMAALIQKLDMCLERNPPRPRRLKFSTAKVGLPPRSGPQGVVVGKRISDAAVKASESKKPKGSDDDDDGVITEKTVEPFLLPEKDGISFIREAEFEDALQYAKKVEAEKVVLVSQVEKLEAEKSDLVSEVHKLKSEKCLLMTTHAEEKLSLEDKVKKLEAEKFDLVSEVERLKSEKSLLTTTHAEEKLSLEDKVSSLETIVAEKVAFFKDLDTDNTEKYKKYEADYVRRIKAKYFSKKNLYGGNIFENETTIENEVIKSSRWPSTRSYTDPVQSFEDHSRSSSTTSAAETSANLSSRKYQSKKSSS